jgi:hypothetical protein
LSKEIELLLQARGGVMHLLRFVVVVVLLSGAVGTLLYGQVSEADKKKRDAFLKAREEMRTVPSSKAKATPAGKPKPAAKKSKKAAATPTPTPKKKAAAKEEEETSAPKKATTPAPTATATPAATVAPVVRETPVPRPIATPTPPPATPPSAVTSMPDQINIEKSGLEDAQGYEPPPPPPPRRRFLFWTLGPRRPAYRYLSNNTIEAIRRAPVQRSRWKFIIVHNSGTRQGSAKAFDYYHRRVRRMQNGMAYHFVVGNGTSTGDGAIEIGERWRRQINGGHVHSDYLNNISLGICLVGDFNRDQPTRAQLEATEELIKYLRERCGKADGRVMGVRPHKEMNPPRWATDCPGDAFPYAWFRRF